jgi:hypothetical protein
MAGLDRPSTSCFRAQSEDVDAAQASLRSLRKLVCKRGHDGANALPPGRRDIRAPGLPFRVSPNEGSGAPEGASRCRLRGRALCESALASRRSTGGDFSPRGRVSVRGICAADRAASSSQSGRSTARAGSQGLPGAVRARHGARAPHQTSGSRPWPSTGVGGRILRPQGRISGPNPGRLTPALHRSAPPQDAS